MLARLAQPAPFPWAAAVALGICLLVALYCLLYSALSGQAESLGQAFAWAIVNILPWLAAFEWAKRASHWTGMAAVLALAFALSLFLGTLASPQSFDPAFELARRVPALCATLALLIVTRRAADRAIDARPSEVELPLAPDQIDWVTAAGNYIEIRAAGRTVVRRSSLSAAESELVAHGFVRIHRSTLVRRDCIARVRPVDVLLRDGTSLKTGKRYRSALTH